MRMLSLSLFFMLAMCLQGCGGGNAPDASAESEPAVAESSSTGSKDLKSTDGASGEMSDQAKTPPTLPGEAATATGSTLNYIPEDAVAVVLLRPKKALSNPLVKQIISMMDEANPRETIASKFEDFAEEMGINIQQVDHVLVVIDQQTIQMLPFLMGLGALPHDNFDDVSAIALQSRNLDLRSERRSITKPVMYQPSVFDEAGPKPTPILVIQLAAGVSSQKILNAVPNSEMIDIAGGKGVMTPDGGVLFQVSDSRLIYSSKEKLEGVLNNSKSGAVRAMIEKSVASDFALAVDLEPVKGFLQQAMQSNPNPMMGLVMPLVTQMKTLAFAADLEAANLLHLSVETPNAEAAEGVQGMLSGFMNMGKQQYEQMKKDVPAEMQSLTGQLVSGASLATTGSIVSLNVPRPDNFEQLPEMLKPAIAEARKATQNAHRKNNLKQVGLAFHNYHDVYKHFPALDSNGEKDDANVRGKGLSWRVHLLPFLEGAPLYEQFKLDEAWDSEHNKSLIAKMPRLFGENAEGKTSLHVFAGEGLAFEAGKPGKGLRDYTDGSSNTILVVEAGDDTAEIWTKPSGLALDAADPLAALGKIGETFLVLMCDGSVHDLSKSLNKTTFSNLIQHNDGNVVEF